MTINRRLLALNLFSADVMDGLGPGMAIYVGSMLHWEFGRIGIALAMVGAALSSLVAEWMVELSSFFPAFCFLVGPCGSESLPARAWSR
ncbi:MAG: hypothetical protein GDA41_08090 [Rhodospirillales bacterium]|nr:hypothetical protein [Rhodospirillales bacterium]